MAAFPATRAAVKYGDGNDLEVIVQWNDVRIVAVEMVVE